MKSLEADLNNILNTRITTGTLRSLKNTNPVLSDFTSNDYLGLSRSAALQERIHEKFLSLELHNGASGSRLLSGNSAYTEEVEQKLATLFRGEAALIFNSGYAANVGVFSSVPKKNDTILYDELSHASIKDGIRLSLATRYPFHHNNLDDLENKIKRSKGRIFIAVESIYSMDGDECPLVDLVSLAEKHNASIILDEAHSTGSRGPDGSGLASALGLQDQIDIRIYTFGKAMGVHGACVVGSKILIQYLINFARAFIYTTALSPHSIVSIDQAFDYLKRNIDLQARLQSRIDLFLKHSDLKNSTESRSAIQTKIFQGNETIKQNARHLQSKGFDIRPILSPTVAKDAERLRICLHTFNSDDEIINLGNELKILSASS
jgi:8-amino-7-oxononanoate synthase